jgi:hypothetical protein
MFVADLILHPSYCMINFSEMTVYSFHFYLFFQMDHPNTSSEVKNVKAVSNQIERKVKVKMYTKR